MIRFVRFSMLVVIVLSVCMPFHAVAVQPKNNNDSPPLRTSTVSADSLERPSIIYHDQRQGNDYTHADMALNEKTHTVHMIYSRQEGNRYKVYYQQRPTLDYDLSASNEMLLADEPVVQMASNAFQYPRIAVDATGTVHAIWVIKDTLYYRACFSSVGNCTSIELWGNTITWRSPILDVIASGINTLNANGMCSVIANKNVP